MQVRPSSIKPKVSEILTAALPLFVSKGYTATSMRDIAASMNIRAASLYAHIKGKEEILELFCFGMSQEFIDCLNHIKTSEISPELRLKSFVEAHLNLVLKSPEITSVYTQEWKHLGKRKNEFIELRKSYEKEVEDLLRILNAQYTPLQAEFSSRLILQNLNSAYLWTKSFDKEFIKSTIINLIFNRL